MAVQTQNRPPLKDTVQQANATSLAALLALQIQTFDAAGSMAGNDDLAECDATDAAFTLTLPGATAILGKEYVVKETSGANAVTVDAEGAGTIDGSANLVVPARQAAVLVPTAISDAGVVTWQKVSSSSATGSDSTALHVDIANEITSITAKAAPALADEYVQEDSAAAYVKKATTLGTMLGAAGQVTNLAAATILVTDKIAFEDASDTLAMKEATVQQLFAAPAWVDGLAAKATPVAADTLPINDSAAAGAAAKVTIGSIPIAQAQVAGILLEPAADAAVTILGTTRAVVLTVTAAATVAIADGAGLYAGQIVSLRAAAVSGGGSYTLAVQGGALTMNATGEEPEVMRNAANSAWVVIRLGTATIV
jgi:hypothetical protein